MSANLILEETGASLLGLGELFLQCIAILSQMILNRSTNIHNQKFDLDIIALKSTRRKASMR